MRPSPSIALALLVGAFPARAELLDELKRGPLVLVENGRDGKFALATAIALIDAPADKVWEVLVDFQRYVEFAPKLIKSDAKPLSATEVDVELEIDNPGPNAKYTIRHDLDPAGLRIESRQVAGDLKGSTWGWSLERVDAKKTLARYHGSVKNFSSMAEALEDDQQTVTVGLNVTAVIAFIRSVKNRAEAQAKAGK